MNDDQPHSGTPGIVGGPPAPPRLKSVRYMGLLIAQFSMGIVVIAITWVMSRMW
ncbi:hypothetical protein SAMN02799625_05328 [Methylobacterium sp. UNC300MFChir4.1]|uniref:hypothetical protein n=1 Tax=unclassified Methylobacterium TaxID=2615210 RepID=UPI0008C73B15|nr:MULTISPECIES: hypothetical protein [unclassified Methylobacterium]SEP28881.1 hypothetical protein SAMN02799625_05328 [Methylobacterium sp. UNC300MFChir4.1]